MHGQLTQRGEVGLGEEGINSRPRLFGHVDLAVTQALQQFTRRQVDQQQLVGFLQHPVGQGFTHLNAGDTAHLIVETFKVLDIDGGIHVDPRRKQLLDVLPALGMPAAGGIAVCQFIHQHQFRPGLEQAVEVHFLQHHATVFGAHQGLLRQAGEQRFGLGATMGFHHPGDDFHALTQLGVGGLQHGVGLADTGGGAQKNLESTATVAGQFS
ncbi:hypothetical protein D3C71_1535040 [compost metagenome]